MFHNKVFFLTSLKVFFIFFISTLFAADTGVCSPKKLPIQATPVPVSCCAKTTPNNPVIGFTSCPKEINAVLPIQGTLPKWLKGDFIAIGPGLFEIKESKAKHWFDGFGMIYSFSFQNDKVNYTNRMIDSTYYQDAVKNGKILGSGPTEKKSTWSKLSSALSSNERPPYDNTNINIIPHNKQIITLTESPHHFCVDPTTLKTTGKFSYSDDIQAHFSSAHPIFDSKTKEWYGLLINFAHTSNYIIYKRAVNSTKREVIATIPVGYPSYIHSFAMTNKYIIITETPFTVSPYDLLMTDKSFIETFSWKPKTGSKFIIVDRHKGTVVATCKTEAFFTLHHVNAFEKDGKVILDLIAYQDPSIISSFYMDKIYANQRSLPSSELRRYTITPKTQEVSWKLLTKTPVELPNINHTNAMKEYRHLYCNSNDQDTKNMATQVCKIDITNGKNLIWQCAGCYPSEPIFVAAPHHVNEDDGVILSLVLDSLKQKSFLVILDAKSFKELARVNVPHHIPFTVHSKFFTNHC